MVSTCMLGRLPSALKTSPGEVAISGNQWQSEAIALMTSSGEAFASSPNHWSISVHALSAFVFTSMPFATCAEDDNQGRSEALTDNQGSSQGQTREIEGDQARCIEIKGYLLLRRAVERAHACHREQSRVIKGHQGLPAPVPRCGTRPCLP